MFVLFVQPDPGSAIHNGATVDYRRRRRAQPGSAVSHRVSSSTPARLRSLTVKAGRVDGKVDDKPVICTADELHYVHVPDSHWRLALWRYLPLPQGTRRNHPLLLLSGVGTNAVGYDLAPGASFARHMSSQGFDTWILEVRGAGLSAEESLWKFSQPFFHIPEGFPSFVYKGLLEERLVSVMSSRIRGFREQLDLVSKYDWDFDHYLEEDVPAAIGYIRAQCRPKDGKVFAIGHSMGGILLYAMLSRDGFQGWDSDLASVVTLGSSLDYTTSRSSLKQLLPLIDPAQALNIPIIPLGTLLAAAYPLVSHPPYLFSWLSPHISAQNMMLPELFEKLVLNNFCTIPAKLLLHLSTAFREGGLCNRRGTLFYKDHLYKSEVPVLAIAGDQDTLCPPEAAYETIKRIPKHLVTFKVFGDPNGPHYAHYDLVGSRMASGQVYPCIIEFLSRHD